jgi:hypothetical protein
MAFIWVGTKIWERNQVEVHKTQQKPLKSLESELPRKKPQKSNPAYSECPRYLGYLYQRQKQQKIPAKCLACEKAIHVFLPTETNS